MTLRPQNRCCGCGYTWYPRGSSVSAKCPSCGNPDVVPFGTFGSLFFRRARAPGSPPPPGSSEGAVGWAVVGVIVVALVALCAGLANRRASPFPDHRQDVADADPARAPGRGGSDRVKPPVAPPVDAPPKRADKTPGSTTSAQGEPVTPVDEKPVPEKKGPEKKAPPAEPPFVPARLDPENLNVGDVGEFDPDFVSAITATKGKETILPTSDKNVSIAAPTNRITVITEDDEKTAKLPGLWRVASKSRLTLATVQYNLVPSNLEEARARGGNPKK